jgi:hypothetical protein
VWVRMVRRAEVREVERVGGRVVRSVARMNIVMCV